MPIRPDAVAPVPRAVGTLRLSTKRSDDRSVLNTLHQQGSFKCLFPRPTGPELNAVVLNTAGGVTGGDTFRLLGQMAPRTELTLTTQACERAYKAHQGQTARIFNHLKVGAHARINWLPQETILFNGSDLDRKLLIELASDAAALIVEPLIFGRAAMGEKLTEATLRDRIEIRRNGHPLFLDAVRMSGDLNTHLAKANIADGAGALALVVYIAPDAEVRLDAVRHMLPDHAGASLIRNDVLAVRLLAAHGFALRQSLIPILRHLNADTLPRCWTI